MSDEKENPPGESGDFERIILDANDFVVKTAPNTIRYIPSFIDEELEEYLIRQVNNAPKPKWEFLRNRRLQNWGGVVSSKFLLADGDMPTWLNIVIDKLMDVQNAFSADHRPNHVLVNEYLPGQGIMPHTDGPAFHQVVATVSLGSHTFLDLYEPLADDDDKTPLSERYVGSMLLQPRSLIVITDDAYIGKLHGIEEREIDVVTDKLFNRPANLEIGTKLTRTTRISLTIRNVPRVKANFVRNLLFGKSAK